MGARDSCLLSISLGSVVGRVETGTPSAVSLGQLRCGIRSWITQGCVLMGTLKRNNRIDADGGF